MKKMALIIAVSLLSYSQLSALCYKCEEIRERNKKLPPLKYQYYDDYLESLKNEGEEKPAEIDFTDEESNDSEEFSIAEN